MSKEINLSEILNKCHREAVKGMESIHTKAFPQAYTRQAINAMREACEQIVDLCAENAKMISGYYGEEIYYGIDKQSILDVKKLVK